MNKHMPESVFSILLSSIYINISSDVIQKRKKKIQSKCDKFLRTRQEPLNSFILLNQSLLQSTSLITRITKHTTGAQILMTNFVRALPEKTVKREEIKRCSTVTQEFRHALDTLCSVKLSHCLSVSAFVLTGHDDHEDGLRDLNKGKRK